MVAPGTALREGIDNIVHARTGAMVIVADPDEVSFMYSGGIKLDLDYSPAMVYQVAKMDGAIVLNATAIAAAMSSRSTSTAAATSSTTSPSSSRRPTRRSRRSTSTARGSMPSSRG